MEVARLTQQQEDYLEVLAEDAHLILLDDLGDGSALMTPARFCGCCGGDGFVERDQGGRSHFEPCGACGGRGGIPVTMPAQRVTPEGKAVRCA